MAWLVQLITLSLPTRVEVDLGCDNTAATQMLSQWHHGQHGATHGDSTLVLYMELLEEENN